jgi:hypothetical protein
MVQVDFVCEILVNLNIAPDAASSLRKFYCVCHIFIIISVWHNKHCIPLCIRLDHLLAVYLLPDVPLVNIVTAFT